MPSSCNLISCLRRADKKMRILSIGWTFLTLACPAAEPALPNARPLEWPEADLSGRLMDGAHRFIESKIAEAPARRSRFWHRDFSSAGAYTTSIEPNRKQFQTIIGAVDSRLPSRMERFGDDENPAVVAETSGYIVSQ